MDRALEEMQFLGPFGIYRESIKIIVSWRKILTRITLAFTLPPIIILLAHMKNSDLLVRKILDTGIEIDVTRPGTQAYHTLDDALTSKWFMYWLLMVSYFTFLLVFSHLSTSAVAYTIACIYTSREVTFKIVISAILKVRERVIITFLYMFLAFFVYGMMAIALVVLYILIVPANMFGMTVVYFILILCFIEFVYMGIIWQLASVVAVLESSYGLKAMMKSKDLIKGKGWVAVGIYVKLNFFILMVQVVFQMLVVDSRIEMWKRIGFELLCLFLLLILCLFGLVSQTVLYLVCKSYHHESIDKSRLEDLLESCPGAYEPLKGDIGVTLEKCQV